MQDGGKIQSFASLGLANRRAQQPAKNKQKKTNTEKTNTRKTKTKKINAKKDKHTKDKHKKDKHTKDKYKKRQTQERHAQKNLQNLSWSDQTQSPWRRGAWEWQTQEIPNFPTKRTRASEGNSRSESTNHRACF